MVDALVICEGKEPFADRSLAEKVAVRRRRSGKNVRVYKCANCGLWHMGNAPVKAWKRGRPQ